MDKLGKDLLLYIGLKLEMKDFYKFMNINKNLFKNPDEFYKLYLIYSSIENRQLIITDKENEQKDKTWKEYFVQYLYHKNVLKKVFKYNGDEEIKEEKRLCSLSSLQQEINLFVGLIGARNVLAKGISDDNFTAVKFAVSRSAPVDSYILSIAKRCIPTDANKLIVEYLEDILTNF